MLYTRDIAKAIRKVDKKVPELITSVVEHPNYLELRVYENQIMAMDINRRMAVMEYLLQVRDVVSSFGVRCELGGVEGDPPK